MNRPALFVIEGPMPGPHVCDDPGLTCAGLQRRFPAAGPLRAVEARGTPGLWYVREESQVIARGRTELEAVHHARDVLLARRSRPPTL